MNLPPLPQLKLWIDPDRLDGPAHMARDEALLSEVEAPTLRVYRWPNQQLSIGYFCKLADVRAEFGDVPIVRRWTGGGIVTHGTDWTFSLVIPGNREAAAELYCRIHRALIAALREEGLQADLQQAVKTSAPGGACFVNPVESDVMHDGQKIAGGAQRRNRRGVLHQGSLLFGDLDSNFFERFGAMLAQRVSTWVPSQAYLNEASRLESHRYATQAWLEKY